MLGNVDSEPSDRCFVTRFRTEYVWYRRFAYDLSGTWHRDFDILLCTAVYVGERGRRSGIELKDLKRA